MTLQWHFQRVGTGGADPYNLPVGMGSPGDGSVIERLLVKVTFRFGEPHSFIEGAFAPRPILVGVGYFPFLDPFSTPSPEAAPDYDWLYTDIFNQEASISVTPTGEAMQTYRFGGSATYASLQGKRTISDGVDTLNFYFGTVSEPFISDDVVYGTVMVKTLVDHR